MIEDERAAARRGLARIEAAVASLTADELDALRAVAAAAVDEGDDVGGFGAFGTLAVLPSGNDAPMDDMFAVMMAYQKLANAEAREDRQLGSTASSPSVRRRLP